MTMRGRETSGGWSWRQLLPGGAAVAVVIALAPVPHIVSVAAWAVALVAGLAATQLARRAYLATQERSGSRPGLPLASPLVLTLFAGVGVAAGVAFLRPETVVGAMAVAVVCAVALIVLRFRSLRGARHASTDDGR
ncbi:hypothetical protein SAMN05216467_3221 [Cellulomonas sp. KH9]|nr:hypothetical protein SAMN05216467_3221 [Cellulomonas sp. KH9]